MEEMLIEDSNEGIVAEQKPRVGMTFSSEDEAYNLYNHYAGIVGFSVRKAYAYKKKDDKSMILGRTFVCNKEGCKAKDKRDIHTIKSRAETRTNCLARMSISRLPNGRYECRNFVEDHNHELHTPETDHFMRSQRAISSLDALQIDLADESGLRPKATFEYLGMQVGGRENLGYTRLNLKNYLRTKLQRELVYGEAGWLSMYFATQSRINPSFTYSMQYDKEEQITNIFWADPRMIANYQIFGDVLSFDTTFCTNKEYRPLGIFAGFNHHRGVTIYGAALLYDETIESFKWLFDRFLEAHGEKRPITIFIDQDPSMARAISEVLPSTKHGLCTWHLMQNAIKKVGNLMKGGSCFLHDFKKCVYEYLNEWEFETAWKKLVDDYPVDKPSWFDRTYEVKEKWARCYMKNTLTLGMRNTQISESFNADLKDYLKCTHDLPNFFRQFERVLEAKRANELKAEFDARNFFLPQNMGSKALILRQAGNVYTPYAYDLFLEEYNWKDNCYLKSRIDSNVLCQYVLGRMDEKGTHEKGEFQVLYTPSEHSVYCSCSKFETLGILCCHALKVFDLLDVKSIPEVYILRRWTRDAKRLVADDSTQNQVKEDARLDYNKRWRYIVPKYLRILTEACYSAEGFDVALSNADVFRKDVASLGIAGPSIQAPIQCVDLNKELKLKKKERIKGGRRHKSCVEKQRKRKKTDQMQPPASVPPIGFQDSQCPRESMSVVMTLPSSQALASTPAILQSTTDIFHHLV